MNGGFLTPHRRRWVILALIFCAIVLNYFDRQIVSILKPTLKAEFRLDDAGYALLANIFTVCYACMYPVAGWLVDRLGARSMMLTGSHRVVQRVPRGRADEDLRAVRLLPRDAGPGGADRVSRPTARGDDLVSRHLAGHGQQPVRGRGFHRGDHRAAAGGLADTAVGNWHAAFIVPGRIGPGRGGAVVADLSRPARRGGATGHRLGGARRRPRSSPGRNCGARAALWGILLIRFISDPVWYFCLFWLPGYLQEQSGLTLAQIGMVGWIPFLAADLGGVGSAAWSDWLVKRGTPARARAQAHAHHHGGAGARLRADAAPGASGGHARHLQRGGRGVPELAVLAERGDRRNVSHRQHRQRAGHRGGLRRRRGDAVQLLRRPGHGDPRRGADVRRYGFTPSAGRARVVDDGAARAAEP